MKLEFVPVYYKLVSFDNKMNLEIDAPNLNESIARWAHYKRTRQISHKIIRGDLERIEKYF